MAFVVKAQGITEVITRFERMGSAAIDATPAMEVVAGMMMGFIERTFQSQGRRGGGSWKRDTPDWLARKIRNEWDPRIGYATHRLVKSLTEPGAEGQRLEITPHSVHLASDLSYAATQQRNRPFAKFTVTDRLALRTTVRDYLIAAWKLP